MSIPSRLLVLAALIAPAILLMPLPAAVATTVAVALLCVLPGAALSRALDPEDPVLAVLVTVAASVAVTVAVSTALLYLGVWSGPAAATGVGLVTVAVVLGSEWKQARDVD